MHHSMKSINYSGIYGCFYAMLLMAMITIVQCSSPVEYEALVQKELASGVRNDSLFLGVYFGMPRKAFYDHCWMLNKKNVLKDGMGNMTAAYPLTELKHPAVFEFYPTFQDDKINTMPAFVHYDAWAPWNKELSAENLVEDMKNLLEKWHDVTFYPIVSSSVFSIAYVSVKGNQKILIDYAAENKVDVIYTDLTNAKDLPVVIRN